MSMNELLETLCRGTYDLLLEQDSDLELIAQKINDDQLKELVDKEGYGGYPVKLICPTSHYKRSGFELVEVPTISITISTRR